jgi:hypothetical protein
VARERDAHSETRDTVVAAPFPRTTTSRSRASPASLDRGARLHWPSVRVDLYHVTPCRSCSRPVRDQQLVGRRQCLELRAAHTSTDASHTRAAALRAYSSAYGIDTRSRASGSGLPRARAQCNAAGCIGSIGRAVARRAVRPASICARSQRATGDESAGAVAAAGHGEGTRSRAQDVNQVIAVSRIAGVAV